MQLLNIPHIQGFLLEIPKNGANEEAGVQIRHIQVMLSYTKPLCISIIRSSIHITCMHTHILVSMFSCVEFFIPLPNVSRAAFCLE